jgi:hypothetical protein
MRSPSAGPAYTLMPRAPTTRELQPDAGPRGREAHRGVLRHRLSGVALLAEVPVFRVVSDSFPPALSEQVPSNRLMRASPRRRGSRRCRHSRRLGVAAHQLNRVEQRHERVDLRLAGRLLRDQHGVTPSARPWRCRRTRPSAPGRRAKRAVLELPLGAPDAPAGGSPAAPPPAARRSIPRPTSSSTRAATPAGSRPIAALSGSRPGLVDLATMSASSSRSCVGSSQSTRSPSRRSPAAARRCPCAARARRTGPRRGPRAASRVTLSRPITARPSRSSRPPPSMPTTATSHARAGSRG